MVHFLDIKEGEVYYKFSNNEIKVVEIIELKLSHFAETMIRIYNRVYKTNNDLDEFNKNFEESIENDEVNLYLRDIKDGFTYNEMIDGVYFRNLFKSKEELKEFIIEDILKKLNKFNLSFKDLKNYVEKYPEKFI